MYYKTEVLDNLTYDHVLSQDLGYDDSKKITPTQTRKGDAYSYVRVSEGDELKIRVNAKGKWIK